MPRDAREELPGSVGIHGGVLYDTFGYYGPAFLNLLNLAIVATLFLRYHSLPRGTFKIAWTVHRTEQHIFLDKQPHAKYIFDLPTGT